MTPALARLLTRLYPRNWRARYGAEFEAFLLDREADPRGDLLTAANVVCSAFGEHISPTQVPVGTLIAERPPGQIRTSGITASGSHLG